MVRSIVVPVFLFASPVMRAGLALVAAPVIAGLLVLAAMSGFYGRAS